MTESNIAHYLNMFSHLHTDRSAGWTTITKGQAPHKSFLLLSVLDQFAQGNILTNLIRITPELGELFAAYWSKVFSPERRGNMALPFFHLRSSGFWHLVPLPGQNNTLADTRQANTLSQLDKLISGACLDDDLYKLMQVNEARNVLRVVLIQTYFAPELHPALLEQSEVNLQAFLYSQHLIEQARMQVKEATNSQENYQPAIRTQGFRRAVVRIYDHRCAFCGVRLLTSDGHTAVDAAHIIPWRICQDDNPKNGLALCGLCHWTFDEGLLGVSSKYQVLLSGELRITQNVSGHLLTLEHRQIIGPSEQDLWPRIDALEWHLQNVFRRG